MLIDIVLEISAAEKRGKIFKRASRGGRKAECASSMSVGIERPNKVLRVCARKTIAHGGLPAKAGIPERESPRATKKSYDVSADLVIMAGWLHPIPFRTRP